MAQKAAGLKHRSQVRSGCRSSHRSGYKSGQVRSGQVRSGHMSGQIDYIFGVFGFINGIDNVNWSLYRDFGRAYKLFTLGTVSCFSEMNIQRF